jgi:energy-coupling factor transporter ATP-binding protein EcfA2
MKQPGKLVVLTGASGSGKTTIARRLEPVLPHACSVFFFDSIGVPSLEGMKEWGEGHQPGGAWMRAMTLEWLKRIAAVLATGQSVLFEGQMRIAFILEGLAAAHIGDARILLLDCDDQVRASRLQAERNQPELANFHMMNWARYLREEAAEANCERIDTGGVPVERCMELLSGYLSASE